MTTQIVELNELNRTLFELNDGKDFGKCADVLAKFLGEKSGQQINEICSQCSPKRRQLFLAFEKFIQMDWEQNRFKTLSHPLIGQIASIIFPIAGKIQFSQSLIWFGGISSIHCHNLVCSFSTSNKLVTGELANENEDGNCTQQIRLNSIKYFSIGIFLLGFMEKLEEIISTEDFEHFFRRIDTIFATSPNSFMDALLENDERCLRTMAALLRLPSPPNWLNSMVLFILLLHKIQFDSLIFIDWIGSEPELSYIFMKLFTQHLAQYSIQQIREICYNANKIPINTETKWHIFRAKTDANSNSSNDNFFHFNIHELHGEQRVFRRISVPTKSNNSIYTREEEEMPSTEMLLTKLAQFCVELERKLLKLSAHLKFPSKIICQNLTQIQSTISPD